MRVANIRRGGCYAARSSVVRLLGFAVAVLLFASPLPARAQVYWNAQSGDWSNGDNWWGYWSGTGTFGPGVPTSTNYACIYNGGTATIAQSGAECGYLSVGGTAGSGFVQMTDGSLTVQANGVFVGDTGLGNFTQSGGTSTVCVLALGENKDSSGAL